MMSSRGAPGRSIGVCRAYVALAQRYGLDAVMADATQDYGLVEAAPDLVELVEAAGVKKECTFSALPRPPLVPVAASREKTIDQRGHVTPGHAVDLQ